MKTSLFILAAFTMCAAGASAQAVQPAQPALIEVTGSATLRIVPDCIAVEIGMEEYFQPVGRGDSTIVKIADIEKSVRSVLRAASVPDSLVVVSDMGNYRDARSSAFMMGKCLTATVRDFDSVELISQGLDRRGITSFSIASSDNSDMERYNQQGLASALDAAKRKAQFIADNEGLELLSPYEIVETTSEPAAYSAFSKDRKSVV